MTTAVHQTPNFHGVDPPDLGAVDHMHRRRSLAPVPMGPYGPASPGGPSPGGPAPAPATRPVSAYGATTGPGPVGGSASAQHKARMAAQMRDVGRAREQRVGDYIVKQTLGKGTFSKVYLGEYRPTKQKVALKFIKPKSPQGGSTDKHNIRVEREIRLLSLLHHPNIVRLYDVIQTPKFTMIVMEHNSGGELLHHIRKRNRLHESEARGLFRQIVSAVDYMHQNCVIHRDLKMENVMMDRENRVRLIDFGFANTFEWDKQLDTFCGSPFYAAPEMVNGIKYTGPEVDIWSMGVILFFMLCGRTPFEGECLKEIYDKISRGRFEVPQQRSREAQDLLRRILTVDPRQRITMKGIIEHPWLNKDFDQPVSNHMQPRPAVVLNPCEQSLQKMPVYKYSIADVTAALARPDMAKTPMVCIYHLVDESRRRKATRNARRSHAPNPTADSPDSNRPVSRGRHHPDADLDLAPPAPVPDAAPPSARSTTPRHHHHSHSHHDPGALAPPQPPYLATRPSDLGSSIEAASFGASQYGQPRMRKASNASAQVSVSSSLNLDASSHFLRDDDRRASRSSRFFDRVRKSMPFMRNRRSQIMDAQPADPPQTPRNRASFFRESFRRLSAAPSAPSMAISPGYARQMPPPPPLPQQQQQQQQQQQPLPQSPVSARPRTANGDARPSLSPTAAAPAVMRPATSAGGPSAGAPRRHRHTDFGPQINRRSELAADLPADAPRRASRPLSVSSSRQMTPLRLHPAQGHQQAQPPPPMPIRGAGAQLPAALTSRGSAPVFGGSGAQQQQQQQQQQQSKLAMRGMFNLKCIMVGPLDDISATIERVLKAKYIALRKMSDVLYSCDQAGIRFEISIHTVQGHLHTIKFKRLEGSWWSYKKLTTDISADLQAIEQTGH